MSKISHLPKTLPVKELPFQYEGTGDLTGHKYSGDFVVKVPSNRDIIRISSETAKLSGGIPVDLLDGGPAMFNRAIAFLQICLIEAPAWFANSPQHPIEEGMSYGLDSHDANIPIEIFQKAETLVQEWQDKLKNGKALEKTE